MITKASSRVVATLALAAALTASGCGIMSPVQTDNDYQAADGTNLDLGNSLDVRSLVVVGSDQGGDGRLSGQFVNGTGETVAVSFSVPGGQAVTASVPAHDSINLADEELVLSGVKGKPGDLLPVSVSTPATGDNVLNVPIVPAEGYYKDLAP